jgi:tol-pal system protein YbgF
MDLKRLRWVIILLVLFLASCVYENEFTYMNDQILALNKRVAELEGSVDSRLSNQADMSAELGIVKRDIGELTGRIEDNENLIKRVVEKDLGNQDAIKNELGGVTRLSARMDEIEKLLRQQQGILGLETPKIPEGESPEAVAAIEGASAVVPALYEQSLTAFKEEKYEKAQEGFSQFLKENPKSEYADNAQYWLGECLMGLKQYEQAILAFNDVIKKFPKGNKVSNAMYRQAVAFIEIDDKISAKLLLEKVIKQYPNEEITNAAKAKLKSIQ